MTWEIVVGLITLAGILITFGTIVAKNASVMTELKCAVKELNETIGTNDKRNSDSHSRLFSKQNEHDKKLDEHELRIHDLEIERKR